MSEPVQPESSVALMVPADSELIVREATMSADARDRLAAIRTCADQALFGRERWS